MPLPSSPHWAPTITMPAMSWSQSTALAAAARNGGASSSQRESSNGSGVCAAATGVGAGVGQVELALQAPVVAEHRQRVAAHLVQPRDRAVADLGAQLRVRPRVPLVLGDVRRAPALLARSGSW